MEEELAKEEEAARIKWESFEKVCVEQLRSLPQRADLSKASLRRLNNQLNALSLFFQLLKTGLTTKAYAFKLAGEQVEVTASTVRERYRCCKLTDGKMLDQTELEESVSNWLLENKDVQEKAIQFVRDNAIRSGDKGNNMTIDDFHRWINGTLLKETSPGMTVA